jgi:hypothetical protein
VDPVTMAVLGILAVPGCALVVGAATAGARARFGRADPVRWSEEFVRAARRCTTVTAASGVVRIEGRAGGEGVAGPISGKPCVAYVLEIEDYGPVSRVEADVRRIADPQTGIAQHRRTGLRWRRLHRSVVARPFDLVDDDGVATVLADPGAMVFARMRVESRTFFGSPAEKVAAILARTGTTGARRPLLVRESRIEPGESCTVIGEPRIEAGSGSGGDYRRAPSRLLIGHGEYVLHVFSGSGPD